jgi:hypothetical protein
MTDILVGLKIWQNIRWTRTWKNCFKLSSPFQNDPYYTCSLGQSPHQFIYSLFNVLALTEIKGYAMIQVEMKSEHNLV